MYIQKIITAQSKIEVVYAGGTISSLATDAGYREGGHVVDLIGLLRERVPNFKGNFIVDQPKIVYTGLSENINEEYWEKIEEFVRNAFNRNPKAVIITHGTDSMEQTARRLKKTFWEDLKKNGSKIILTGANDDISSPITDAWDNLLFSFESANRDVDPNVYVAFHRKLIPADLVVSHLIVMK